MCSRELLYCSFFQIKGKRDILHTILAYYSDTDSAWCLKLYVGATNCQDLEKLGLNSFQDQHVIVKYGYMTALGATQCEGGSQLLCNRKLVKVVKYRLVGGREGQLS